MSRCRALAAVFAAALVAAGAGTSRPARADTVDATATTLLSGRPDPRDGTVHTTLPLTELVSIDASSVKNPLFDDLGVVLAAWGQLDPGDPQGGKLADGDIDLGFVQGKAFRGRFGFRFGRQLITTGAARIQPMDGASLTARPWRPLGLQVYGGVPVTPRFGVSRGDAMTGGRVSVRKSIDAEAGVSFVEVLDDGRLSRQDAGFDARGSWRSFTLGGFALWSIPEERLAEGDVGLSWQHGSHFQVTADYRRTAPDLFLPRNSVLAVFSQETRDETGGWLTLRGHGLALDGDWHAYHEESGWGQEGGARLTWRTGPHGITTIAPEVRTLRGTDQGYLQTRVHAHHALTPRVRLSLDLDGYFLEHDINGQDASYTAAATCGWQITPDWNVLAMGLGGATPYFENHLEAMVKIAYHHTLHVRQVTP